jgi:hypothetical protein
MDGDRFDTLARTLKPATRRTLLGGAIGGLLATASLALGREETSARRRNRRRTWNFAAAPLTHLDEHPASSGDNRAYNSKAQITISQRRNRFQICGTFQYHTDAVANSQINVRDVIIQQGTTSASSQALVTFAGWAGTTTFDAGCQTIDSSLAKAIVNDPGAYHVNLRTNQPRHLNGAVAAPLTRQ